MGVTGLWRLIEPAGKPVPVETLENKVLAVDISIWLHQMVKGYQDAKGAPLPNAHLMGLFQRLCKLLYFRIKPVFVFDGAFPDLKKETIAKRQDNKSKYNSESERLKRELALLLTKKTAINSLLGKQISPKKGHIASESNTNDDIFKLPALPQKDETESESEDDQSSSGSTIDLHSVNIESKDFKSLPVKEKYDLLIELKETRKMNSWGRLHELPKKSDNFSDFQMQRLLKRRKVQECIEETEKEMGDTGMSLNELESLLNDEGIETKIESLATRRIASNNTTRFLLINKKALKEERNTKIIEPDEQKQKIEDVVTNETESDLEKAIKMSLECGDESSDTSDNDKKLPGTSAGGIWKDELEEDLQKAIKLSLECEAETDKNVNKTDDSWSTLHEDSNYSTESDEHEYSPPDMSSAKAYIMQYSDFTSKAIDQIVDLKNVKEQTKLKPLKVDCIIEELNNEQSVIIDNIDLSSDEKEITFKTLQSAINNKQQTSPLKCTNSAQESVICIENSVDDIIELENSLDQVIENRSLLNLSSKEMDITKVSESSDDDFEEVTDFKNVSKNAIVQLTLNVKNTPDGDDIFADVFEPDVADRNRVKINDPIHSFHTHTQIKKETNNECQLKDEIKLQNVVKKTEISYVIDTNTNNEKINNKDTKNILIQAEVESVSAENELNQNKLHHEIESTESEPVNKTMAQDKNLSKEKLNSMVDEINSTEKDIMQEKGRLDRIGRNITEQMTKDAQELLQIFGIPYIVAPMEAEAQCAFLETINLTNGTITDDSDIWLFGGRTVYKNFFNHKKNVLQFLAERVEKSYNLTREQLILLALLVGSDYTTGVAGIGPVTALEILSSFPFNKKKLVSESSTQARYVELITGLKEFKQWVRGGKRTDNINLKKKLKNVELAEDFPSIRVVQAYLEPNIEKSNEKFTWGELDITVLRDYTKAKFGWSQNKLDEIINPVIKRIADRKSQKSVKDYFNRKIEFQSLGDQMSKRVKEAIQRMGTESVVEENSQGAIIKKPKKRQVKSTETDSANTNETKPKRKKKDETIVLPNNQVVKVVSENDDKKDFEINIQKTDRFQEIIPQREKDKQNILQNKLKAIELFRKTNIDKKKKYTKRKAILPKKEAGLSESSDSN